MIRQIVTFIFFIIYAQTSIYYSYAASTPPKASCNYKDHNNLTYTDPESGLMWQFVGINLSGDKNWYQIMMATKKNNLLGYTDWRLPTTEELIAFRTSGCVGNTLLRRNDLWSTNPDDDYYGSIIYLDRNIGAVKVERSHKDFDALIVREGHPTGRAEFDRAYESIIRPIEEKEAKATREKEERERQVVIAKQKEEALQREENTKEEKRKQEAIKLLNKQLASKKPNEIYVAAGKYEAKDDYESAKKLYNAIIERFPDHDLAIKSSDRLVRIKDGESAKKRADESGVNDRMRHISTCYSNRASCKAQCESVRNSSDNSNWFSCQSQCDQGYESCVR